MNSPNSKLSKPSFFAYHVIFLPPYLRFTLPFLGISKHRVQVLSSLSLYIPSELLSPSPSPKIQSINLTHFIYLPMSTMTTTTTYGTIPTAGEELVIPHAKDPQQAMSAALATRRPWKEMFRPRSFSVPSAAAALLRLRSNLPYFRTNYAMAILLLVFLGLLWRPVSLVVLVAMLAAWLFLYFLRDEPLVVMGRAVAVLVALSSVTLLGLFMTDATVNLVGSLLVGASAVVAHATLRRTDDLVVGQEAGGVHSATESDRASTSGAP